MITIVFIAAVPIFVVVVLLIVDLVNGHNITSDIIITIVQ